MGISDNINIPIRNVPTRHSIPEPPNAYPTPVVADL